MNADSKKIRALTGALLGTAAGDAVGLPYEGLSRRRAGRFHGGRPLRHRLVLGHGLCSDDTEHACMVAQALLASGGDPDRFARSLAWRLRGWLAGVPAGIGLATLKSILRLWVGFPAHRSGVNSAGNGPAMRAPVLGLFAPDRESMRALVHASTRITHTDPRAEAGAMIVAKAAAIASATDGSLDPRALLTDCLASAGGDAFEVPLGQALEHLERGESLEAFAEAAGMGKGVSGFILHTVPAALFCWLRNPGDFESVVTDSVRLGGDTDTTAAIAGALSGIEVGPEGIPVDWLDRIAEWPRTLSWMRRLAKRLARSNGSERPEPLFWPGLLPRNALFAGIVLTHGFRRLLPPY